MSTSKRHTSAQYNRNSMNGNNESAYQKLNCNEETSAEFIHPAEYRHSHKEDGNVATKTVSSFGILALALSIASLFILPVIFGTVGIVVGIFATKADSRFMGIAAIVIGGFSVIAGLLVYPFF